MSAADRPQNPIINDGGLAFGVYILYFVSYFSGMTAIIGVIIAHLQVRSANPLLKSHYIFQIRTFWIGLLYGFVCCAAFLIGFLHFGIMFLYIGIGVLTSLWWFTWSLVRNIKGIWLSIQRGDCKS